jgi:acyl-CoA synthetase (AMP-forming)/AMP-acid ligase II
MPAPADLTRILAERANATPRTVAYEFVDSGNYVDRLTYGDLHERADRLAANIARHQGGARDPVVILHAPGIEYIVALYACFLAGVPAVPAYPPDPGRRDASRARLSRILSDLGAPTVLAGDAVAAEIGTYGVSGARIITRQADEWPGAELPAPTASDIALIQYTSGSSSAPRGVVVRHGHLHHNMRAIARHLHVDQRSRAMIWLPPYHDMGLIGGILTPLFVGFPARLMAPFEFLKRPLEWLRQISDFGATVSGGPNFAYDLCVRAHAREGGVLRADLSRWEVAFNGAEPVRAQTMEAFTRTFASAGFDRKAFFPCYGLAEATLLVSGGHWDGEQPDGLGRVSCGTPLPDQTVIVVDPQTKEPLADGAEGEVWVSGPSVTDGYWGGNGSADLFAERAGRHFLRTGDAGYLSGGRLVVTGRTKDVLVYCGTNYHAADIEQAAVANVPGLRPVAAAFMAERGSKEEIVVVVEAREGTGSRERLAAEVRRRVLAASGLAVSTVVVGPPGTVPRTSSGKVQRPLCRARYVAGEYDLVAFRRLLPGSGGPRVSEPPVSDSGRSRIPSPAAAAPGDARHR